MTTEDLQAKVYDYDVDSFIRVKIIDEFNECEGESLLKTMKEELLGKKVVIFRKPIPPARFLRRVMQELGLECIMFEFDYKGRTMAAVMFSRSDKFRYLQCFEYKGIDSIEFFKEEIWIH